MLTLSSAATTAVSGSHTVVVNSLATTSSYVSSTLASASDTLSGSLTVGTQTFNLDSSDNTLTSLSAAINAAAAFAWVSFLRSFKSALQAAG